MPYSIEKVDDGYVISVEGQAFLKMSSRRKAAKLLCAMQQRDAGDCEHADEGFDASR